MSGSYIPVATYALYLFLAPGDFSDTSGILKFTEENSNLCVNITIINDSEDEQNQECFAFTILTTEMDVSLQTSQATICITDNDGRHMLKCTLSN